MRGRTPSPERRERTGLLVVHSVGEGVLEGAVLEGVAVEEEGRHTEEGAEGDRSDVVMAEVEAEEAGEGMEEEGVEEEEGAAVLIAQEVEVMEDIN
jgi:hypothetical protein